MKIQKHDLFHGAALAQIAKHEAFSSLNRAPSGQFGHYLVNVVRPLLIKYAASARHHEYRFTFDADDLRLFAVASQDAPTLVLVCGDQTICALRDEDVAVVLDVATPRDTAWVAVQAPPGKSMRVRGSAGELKGTVPHNRFPQVLFDLPLSAAKIDDRGASQQRPPTSDEPPLRDTAWTFDSPQNFDFGPFPDYRAAHHGIVPMGATVDPAVGPEYLLTVFDPELSAEELAHYGPVDLSLASGVMRVDAGAVAWMVFVLSGPAGPWAVHELTLNPQDAEHLAPFRALGGQSHWHLAIIGAGLRTLDAIEIPNSYHLLRTLDQMEHVSRDITMSSFDLAKAQFQAAYTVGDLLASTQK